MSVAGGVPDKMVAIHRALNDAGLDHAFGGALALAWCTLQARGTIDIDVNIFTVPESTQAVLAALPDAVDHSDEQRQLLERDGQVRLWWDRTPVDVFLNTTTFHDDVMGRCRWEPFAGEMLPFLSCADLAVFKAFFNRTKDWADLEAMADAGSLDVAGVCATLASFLGHDDERIVRLRSLSA